MRDEFPGYAGEIPYLSTRQMVEVDRAMIEDYGIELIQMMENAGRNLAHLARGRFLGADPRGKSVAVLAGRGGNGGGALVGARRLHNWGARVRVCLSRAVEDFAGVPDHQLGILWRMGVEIGPPATISGTAHDLILDGIIGYSLDGDPRGAAKDLIAWANDQDTPVLSLDAPSGVDASTGTVYDPAVTAAATLTLALPKEGLRVSGVEEKVGELYLADISVPPELYGGLGLEVPRIFAEDDIVRLR
ncbi:MAG: NAD(P)H-hydrate epimerase [Rubrobacteraceae bacterium]